MLIHANDPYWPSVSLLVKNTGVNGANNNTFLDSSPNNFTVTRTGNVAQGSFGPATGVNSAYFDGNGDNLSVTNNAVFNFSTGDFTLETYYNSAVSLTTGNTLNDRFFFSATGTGGLFFGISTGSAIEVGIGRTGTAWDNRVAITITPNTWNHIAVTRTSGTVRFWLNGAQLGTSFTNTNSYNVSATSLNIGSQGSAYYWNGWLALARASNIARYTTNFTPSTSYTSDANTSLFLQFNNAAIYDAASKNNIETVSATVSSTSIFNLNSIVFNGSSNLFIPSSTDFGFGSGDWTVDGWLYQPSTSADATLIDTRTASNAGISIYSSVATGGNNKLSYANNSAVLAFASVAFTANTWSYWMVKRTSGIVTGFVNGVQVFSVSDTRTLASSTSAYIGRNYTSTQPLNANTFDIRITKGIARPNIVPAIPLPIY